MEHLDKNLLFQRFHWRDVQCSLTLSAKTFCWKGSDNFNAPKTHVFRRLNFRSLIFFLILNVRKCSKLKHLPGGTCLNPVWLKGKNTEWISQIITKQTYFIELLDSLPQIAFCFFRLSLNLPQFLLSCCDLALKVLGTIEIRTMKKRSLGPSCTQQSAWQVQRISVNIWNYIWESEAKNWLCLLYIDCGIEKVRNSKKSNKGRGWATRPANA